MPPDSDESAYLERRARELGLPTDPEAYQDGGLAEAATSASQTEAQVIAAVLHDADIPAWVESSNTAQMFGAIPSLFPKGVRVLVPLGRLADAQKVLAESRQPRAADETEQE